MVIPAVLRDNRNRLDVVKGDFPGERVFRHTEVAQNPDERLRVCLCRDEISEAIETEPLRPVAALDKTELLRGVRLCPDDEVGAPLDELFRHFALTLGHLVRDFLPEMRRHDDHVRDFVGAPDLLLDKVEFTQICHPAGRTRRQRKTVGVLGIAEKRKGHVVDRYRSDVVHVRFVAVCPVADYSLLQVPEAERRQKSLLAVVKDVIIRHREDVEPDVNHMPPEVAGGAEARIVRRLNLVGDDCLLIQNSEVGVLDIVLDALIDVRKIIAVLVAVGLCAPLCLIVYRRVNKVVAGADEVHGIVFRLGRLGRCRGGRRRGWWSGLGGFSRRRLINDVVRHHRVIVKFLDFPAGNQRRRADDYTQKRFKCFHCLPHRRSESSSESPFFFMNLQRSQIPQPSPQTASAIADQSERISAPNASHPSAAKT